MTKSVCFLCAVSFVVLVVSCASNNEPIIDQLTIPERVEPGGRVEFQVTAHDDDGDVLIYTWTVDGTPLDSPTSMAEWTASAVEGTVTVEVRVSDGENDPVIQERSVAVAKPPIEVPPDIPIEVPEIVPAVDLAKHSVPLDQVYFDTFQAPNRAVPLSEASPALIERLRDAIPPIHAPRYETAAEATWLSPKDIVLGYAAGGQAWAYPVRILNFHEIVNDTLAAEPVLISYCPLCFSGIVFSRRLRNRTLTFGNTSALYESDMVMLDYHTGSYWWQVAGQAIVGTLTGEALTLLPSIMTTWDEWQRLYPGTFVLSRDTGFRRNYDRDIFVGYAEAVDEGQFAFPVSDAGRDLRLSPATKVLAVKIGNDVWAYPMAKLGRAAIMDTLGGENLVVFTDPDGPTGAAYQPIAGHKRLTFALVFHRRR